MSYVTWKMEHNSYANNEWDTTTTELEGYYDPIVRVNTGAGKDSFSFKLTNVADEYNEFFAPNDKITISRVVNSDTTSTSDILMIGTLKDYPELESGSDNTLSLEGKNFSETIAEAIVFVDVNNLTIPEALELAVTNAGSKNINFAVTWHPDNPTLKQDGTAFPTIVSNNKYFNKPLKSILEKYSSNTETGDGDYYWHVDRSNRLVWRAKSSTVDYSFNASTDEHKKIKRYKDISGVKNYIILKGGFDPVGHQIQTKYVNWSSVASNGTKYLFYVSESQRIKNLYVDDLRSAYGDNIDSNTYPPYNFTTTWTWSGATGAVVKGITLTNGSTITVTSNDEYVAVLRAEIKVQLANEGKIISEALQYGKLKVELEFAAGVKEWGIGNNIECTIPSIRSIPFPLRIVDIQYTSTSDSFVLEEDEGSLGRV